MSGISMAEEQPAYLLTKEVAVLVRAPVESVRWWRHSGTGPPSFRVGRRVLYARADVDAWLAEARKAGTAGMTRTRGGDSA